MNQNASDAASSWFGGSKADEAAIRLAMRCARREASPLWLLICKTPSGKLHKTGISTIQGVQSANPRNPGWTPLHEAFYWADAAAAKALHRFCPSWAHSCDDFGIHPASSIWLHNDTFPGWKHSGQEEGPPQRGLPSENKALEALRTARAIGAKSRSEDSCFAASLGWARAALELAPLGESCMPQGMDWIESSEIVQRLSGRQSSKSAMSKCHPFACALAAGHHQAAAQIAIGGSRRSALQAFLLSHACRHFNTASQILLGRPELAKEALFGISECPARDEAPTSPELARAIAERVNELEFSEREMEACLMSAFARADNHLVQELLELEPFAAAACRIGETLGRRCSNSGPMKSKWTEVTACLAKLESKSFDAELGSGPLTSEEGTKTRNAKRL